MLNKIKDMKKEREMRKAKNDYDRMFNYEVYKEERELQMLNKLEKLNNFNDKVANVNIVIGLFGAAGNVGNIAVGATCKAHANHMKKEIEKEREKICNKNIKKDKEEKVINKKEDNDWMIY